MKMYFERKYVHCQLVFLIFLCLTIIVTASIHVNFNTLFVPGLRFSKGDDFTLELEKIEISRAK